MTFASFELIDSVECIAAWLIGHACLACDEAGHWMGRLAELNKSAGETSEVKIAASENAGRTLSESVSARQRRTKRDTVLAHTKKGFGFLFLV